MRVENTAAIVTRWSLGTGAVTAEALAKRGAKVFAFDLPAGLEKAQGDGGIEYVAVDVIDPVQVRSAVSGAAGSGLPLRTVVNCAGIGSSMRILGKKGVHDLALYAKVVQVNLIGSF